MATQFALPGIPTHESVIVINPMCETDDELHNQNRLTFALNLAKAADTKLFCGVFGGPIYVGLPANEDDAQAVIDLAIEFNKNMVVGITA